MDRLLQIAGKRGLWVIEDAAQAHGATYKGRRAGTMGVLSGFSFYPGKNLGACGEAGATVGNDPGKLDVIRRLREHGQAKKYYHDSEGYNGRLDAMQAAFLRIKLQHLPEWTAARRRVAGWYREALAGIDWVELPFEDPRGEHVYHLYVIEADRRDALQAHLQAAKVGTGLHYPLPLHQQVAYAYMGLGAGAFPVTERAAARLLSLPMFPELSQPQVEYVAETIRRFYQ